MQTREFNSHVLQTPPFTSLQRAHSIVPLSAELTPEDTNIRIFVSAGFFLLYRSRFPGKQQSLGNTQFNSLVISNPREKIPAPGMRRFHNFPPLFQHPARIRQARNVSGISIQWLSRVSRVFPALRLLTGTFSSGFSIRACLIPPSPGDAPAPRCTRPTARLTWKAGSGAQGVIPASFPGPGSGTGESWGGDAI